MDLTTILYIFIGCQVLIIGFLANAAFRHAKEHYRPQEPEVHNHNTQQTTPVVNAEYHMSPATRERLEKEAQTKFEAAVSRSSIKLEQQLENTGRQVNELLMRLVTDVVNNELGRYREQLARLQKQAEVDLGGIKKQVASHEEELKAKIAQELAAEKEKLVKQIDAKLGDAVGSFLSEALQHNIDLGNQTEYMMALLEEHKADFAAEVKE
jgi:hypothetical protein